MSPEPFKTSDLALAAYLRSEGIKSSRLEVDAGEVVWVYGITDALNTLLCKWQEGPIIDLKVYQKAMRSTRDQMYEKLRRT